jgi:hypothetical protein
MKAKSIVCNIQRGCLNDELIFLGNEPFVFPLVFLPKAQNMGVMT